MNWDDDTIESATISMFVVNSSDAFKIEKTGVTVQGVTSTGQQLYHCFRCESNFSTMHNCYPWRCEKCMAADWFWQDISRTFFLFDTAPTPADPKLVVRHKTMYPPTVIRPKFSWRLKRWWQRLTNP